MRREIIIILLLSTLSTILGLDDLHLNLAVDYFVDVGTKFVCILSCGKSTQKMVKRFASQNIAVIGGIIDKKHKTDQKIFHLCLKKQAIPIGIVIKANCPAFEDAMYIASKNSHFDKTHTHKWLIIEENDIINDNDNSVVVNDKDVNNDEGADNLKYMETPIIGVLKNLNLSVDADVTISINEDSGRHNLYEVFNFGKIRNGNFIIQKIGFWNKTNGLNITKEFKYYRRWDFKEITLKMVISMTQMKKKIDMEMFMSRIPEPGVPVVTQTGTQVLNEVAKLHNFGYNYTVVDRWVGDYNRKHPYSVTDALYYREHDITPVLRFFTGIHFPRHDVLFPSVTFIETRFYYRIPSQGVGKFENQFLRPLSTATWWCVVAIGVLCGIALMLSAIAERRPVAFDFAFFSVFALICQQFFEEIEDMKRISSARKLTILVTGLSCLLIYNYYTSSVVSWLLNGPPPSINSLQELLDSQLQPAFEDTGYTYSWLQLPDYYFNKKNPKAEDVFKRKMLNMMKKGKNIFRSVNDGIDLVRQGGFVYHTNINDANRRISETFTQRELCDLGSLKSMEVNLLYAAVPKNSPYREFFIWSLARLKERGIIRNIQLRTWSHGLKCEGSSPRALALGGAAPAFILLAAGFVLGTVIMVLERLKWKLERTRLNRRS